LSLPHTCLAFDEKGLAELEGEEDRSGQGPVADVAVGAQPRQNVVDRCRHARRHLLLSLIPDQCQTCCPQTETHRRRLPFPRSLVRTSGEPAADSQEAPKPELRSLRS